MGNNANLYLTDEELVIIKNILNRYNYNFYIFGSRIKGNVKKFSDLDLLYQDVIPLNIVNEIKDDFEESNLPFKVDLIARNYCSDEFLASIENDLYLIT